MSWMGSGMEEEDEQNLEDLDDELYHLIQATPPPWITAKIIWAATNEYPGISHERLRVIIFAMLLAMRKTARDILKKSVLKGQPAAGDTSILIPLDVSFSN